MGLLRKLVLRRHIPTDIIFDGLSGRQNIHHSASIDVINIFVFQAFKFSLGSVVILMPKGFELGILVGIFYRNLD
jgi:hypothetical protein